MNKYNLSFMDKLVLITLLFLTSQISIIVFVFTILDKITTSESLLMIICLLFSVNIIINFMKLCLKEKEMGLK